MKQRQGLHGTWTWITVQKKSNRWTWQKPKHQVPTISSIDKSLSWNRHRVWSPTHRRVINEESKVANHNWVDHQACRLLQYINVLANLFIMGNYFNKLRWKIMRANNPLQFIHQVTKNSCSESPWRKRDLSPTWNLDIKSKSSLKFRKYFAKFMIPVALFKKFLS